MFKEFVHSLKRDDNKNLIESILTGYDIIFEGMSLSKSQEAINNFMFDVGAETYKKLKNKYKRKHGEDRIKYIDRLRRKYAKLQEPALA